MNFDALVRRRRMTRAFADRPVAPETVDHIVDLARRAPSAGNTMGLEFLVLSGPDETGRYWDRTLPCERRGAFQWPDLPRAPVLVVVWVSPGAYLRRYAEADKARTGLGDSENAWPVPYWFVDAGAAIMTMLLAAEAEGLGALLFGLFEHEPAVRQAFDVPEDRRAAGAVALGHRAPDRASHSSQRSRAPLEEIIHRGSWGGGLPPGTGIVHRGSWGGRAANRDGAADHRRGAGPVPLP